MILSILSISSSGFTLYNVMILSILSISSSGFSLGLPKRHTNGDVFVTYKSHDPSLN